MTQTRPLRLPTTGAGGGGRPRFLIARQARSGAILPSNRVAAPAAWAPSRFSLGECSPTSLGMVLWIRWPRVVSPTASVGGPGPPQLVGFVLCAFVVKGLEFLIKKLVDQRYLLPIKEVPRIYAVC